MQRKACVYEGRGKRISRNMFVMRKEGQAVKRWRRRRDRVIWHLRRMRKGRRGSRARVRSPYSSLRRGCGRRAGCA